MAPDEIPAWFAILGGIAATILYFRLEFRASSTSSDEGTDRPGR